MLFPSMAFWNAVPQCRGFSGRGGYHQTRWLQDHQKEKPPQKMNRHGSELSSELTFGQ